jgi:hypothetical protein
MPVCYTGSLLLIEVRSLSLSTASQVLRKSLSGEMERIEVDPGDTLSGTHSGF